MNMSGLDIVVTGLAAISSAGVGLEPLKETIRSGSSCLKPFPEEISKEGSFLCGRAEGFRVNDFMPPLKARKFDRCSQMAVVATLMALKDAGIVLTDMDPLRIGIVLGSGFGGIANSSEFLTGYFTGGVDGLAPMLFPNTVANAPASNASIEHGIKGPNVTIVQRFTSFETAFMIACSYLKEGKVDAIITGGVDELTPLMIKGFKSMRQHRRYAAGFGEGCGLMLLERRESALSRGACIKGSVEEIRSVGLLLSGSKEEGIDRLLPQSGVPCNRISLSGTADLTPDLLERLPDAHMLRLSQLTGRSLAMGGLSLVALFLSLSNGETGLHLAASPEGSFFAISVKGGASV